MGPRTATTKNKLTGAIAVSALTAGALATAGLGSAPPANATCASFFGIGNGMQCTSNLTSVAIAIGTNAEAHADGLFGAAFSTGTYAYAETGHAFTFATALGDNASAVAKGIFGIATQLGPNGSANTIGPGPLGSGLGLNIDLNVTPSTTAPSSGYTAAYGTGNITVNLFGNATIPNGYVVEGVGNGNIAVNLGGTNVRVVAGAPTGGNLNLAFNNFGSGNEVYSGPGPLAIAGSILQTNATIIKVGPGFNINGLVVGGAAAVGNAKPASVLRTNITTNTASRSAAAAGTGNGTDKKAATHSAAARSTGSSKRR